MIAGFTIDGSVYAGESGTEVNFDRGVTIQSAPAKRVSKFGDGYKQHLPIGPTVKNISASFSNRAVSEIDIIETYFTLLDGDSFDVLIHGETITVVCLGWNRTYPQESVQTLTAQLREYYD